MFPVVPACPCPPFSSRYGITCSEAEESQLLSGRETKSDGRGLGQEFFEPFPDDQILIPVENGEVSEVLLRHLTEPFDPDAVVFCRLHDCHRIPLVYRNIIFHCFTLLPRASRSLTEGLKSKAPHQQIFCARKKPGQQCPGSAFLIHFLFADFSNFRIVSR